MMLAQGALCFTRRVSRAAMGGCGRSRSLVHHARGGCRGGCCLVAALHSAHLAQDCLLQRCACCAVHGVHFHCHAQRNLQQGLCTGQHAVGSKQAQ